MTPRKFVILGATLALLFGASEARAGGKAGKGNKGSMGNKGSVVAIVTNHGTIQIQLFRKKAPKTTTTFLKYVKSGFYKGTIFHRVISNFMIQGGGMTKNMVRKKTRGTITNEAGNGLSNTRGTVAMARTSNPHSATAQFFINVKDNTFLDHQAPRGKLWGYCVFAKVISGMKVVDKIRYVSTGKVGGRPNVPLRPVVIKRIYVIR
jgi:peptidyl-prolyl cis-trans isomerase B (cyclophilin B)